MRAQSFFMRIKIFCLPILYLLNKGGFMNSKVVICGVDTSSLPKISAVESNELLQRIALGDEKAREDFIVCNMRLVLSVIKRFWAKKISRLSV